MEHGFTYEKTLATAERISWKLDDVIGGDKRLDFDKPFLPEALARVEALDFLSSDERRTLNQIRGHNYLYLFGAVEEFILPFVMDQVRPQLQGDDFKVRAMLEFAAEEAKHIHLFKHFRREFLEGFGFDCPVIGPAPEIARHILSHHPLGVATAILHIEWMTQRHWVESVNDDGDLDPHFKSLLRFHWMEEAQHAKLDTLTIEALAAACSPTEIAAGFADYGKIGAFLDEGLAQQVQFDVATLEHVTGRKLATAERAKVIEVQRQAMRWTFLGSGMSHPNFLETIGNIDAGARAQVEAMAPQFS